MNEQRRTAQMTTAVLDEGAATGEAEASDLVPARMLNEFAYCPRLAYLVSVQGEQAGEERE